MINITSTKSFVVKPAEKTPRGKSIPLSLLDMLYGFPRYNRIMHLYKATVPRGFFDANTLRESLSKVLVHFYPMAGRYTRLDQEQGIIAIDCNDAGVPFVVAESDSLVDDLDLTPSSNSNSNSNSIYPFSYYSQTEVSSYPLMQVQVTYFRCGSVSLGIAVEHAAVDGSSTFHLINSWSEVCRGLDISIPPFLDRTLLRPQDPPQPKFSHEEYTQYSFSGELNSRPTTETKVSVFKITKDTLKKIKAEANQYTTFEALAGHIWKCVCKARNAASDQDSRLFIQTNGRSKNRTKPQLPPGFFGNAIFRSLAKGRVGDLKSKSLCYGASKIHQALSRIDHEYTRSALDFLAAQPDEKSALNGPHMYRTPNFHITSWVGLGLNDADFGWGPPVYSGPSAIHFEKAYIFPGVNGGFTMAISLEPQSMKIFDKLFNEFAILSHL